MSTDRPRFGVACGAHDCHTLRTRAASAHGHSMKNVLTLLTGWVLNVRLVTIPKFPPPPPRQAQKRSEFSWSLQTRTCPSAVTIVSCSRLSEVSPNLRPDQPCPPPSVSPAIPTVGQEPP